MQPARRLTPTTPSPAKQAVGRRPPLWVGLDFPSLALEALSVDPDGQAVIIEPSRRGAVVYRASSAARSAGVAPGLGVNAALAICNGLEIYSRDIDAERRRLQEMHRRLACFTPGISVEPPTTLMLEVGASLNLFGGIKALCRQIRGILGRAGCRYHLAVAPTPGAGALLARAGREVLITNKAELKARLGELPIRTLGLEADTAQGLRALGILSLRELWRLPRPDLARRFGPALLKSMDRVLGMCADPRETARLPSAFECRQELAAETGRVELILSAMYPLLEQLMEALSGEDAQADTVRVSLFHTVAPPTGIDIGTRLPNRDMAHWSKLLRESVERLRLDAPVTAVGIACREFRPAQASTRDLFGRGESARDWARSLDELEARLGRHGLWMLDAAADHRPEYAWRRTNRRDRDAAASPVWPVHRPLWLLHAPRRLRYAAGWIWHTGRLEVLDGPERIEAGWWDGREYCRDYYTAASPQDGRLWIFQDLKQKDRWYLHGLFG